jgi:hypothetical protein
LSGLETGILDLRVFDLLRQRVAEHLAREGEGFRGQPHGLIQKVRIVITRLEIEHHDRRDDLWARAKGAGTNIEEESGVGKGRTFEGKKAVALGAWFGNHPVGHFPLQHDDHSGEKIRSAQQSSKDRGPHRVREIRSDLPRRLALEQFIQVCGESVSLPHFQPTTSKDLDEGWNQILIELESDDPFESIEERSGERTVSRTNLNDPGRFGDESSCNPLGNCFINQEVLAEPAAFGSTHDRSYEF